MVEPLEAAAEASFPDDLLLLDFTSDLDQKGTSEQKEIHQNPNPLAFQDILDPAVDSLPDVTVEGKGIGGEEDEEEELEWLSNKDAFPTLETSFEIPTHSRSSSGSSAPAGERPSPVSVLALAPLFRVPMRARSKGGRRRRRVLSVISLVAPPLRTEERNGEKRKCRHCEAEETPQWRTGPEGSKTLCNACGVRYKSGRLVPEYRPANSPTFSAVLHSNSHRRILEMRRRGNARGRRSNKAPQQRGVL